MASYKGSREHGLRQSVKRRFSGVGAKFCNGLEQGKK